jgi:hypothetical protein
MVLPTTAVRARFQGLPEGGGGAGSDSALASALHTSRLAERPMKTAVRKGQTILESDRPKSVEMLKGHQEGILTLLEKVLVVSRAIPAGDRAARRR